jgi:threonine aldolase
MAEAEVGDEQRGEDPTVRELEETVASLTGNEAAVFLPSGTMCNIVALFVQCQPGDEVILHGDSHVGYSENAGPAVHSRVSLADVPGERGIFDGDAVRAAIQPVGRQKARSRLVMVENTNARGGGAVWSRAALADVCDAAAESGLATHMDGARLMNAAVATGEPCERLCKGFDSVFVDLSKGLGCPMGAVLAGSEGLVEEARWAKHLFGGALRQAGIVAAAGVHALRHHVDRLAEDHERAARLAGELAGVPGVSIAQPTIDTNIVLFDVGATALAPEVFVERALGHGVRFLHFHGSTMRAVTHLGIPDDGITRAIDAVRDVVRDH